MRLNVGSASTPQLPLFGPLSIVRVVNYLAIFIEVAKDERAVQSESEHRQKLSRLLRPPES